LGIRAGTEERFRFSCDNRLVESFRVRFALALGLVAAAAAVAGTLWIAGAPDGLAVTELVRVESLVDDGSPLADHARWIFELLGRERAITEADLSERFTPSFVAGFTAGQLNEFLDNVFDELRSVTFVRYDDRMPTFARAIGVGELGVPLLTVIALAPDGRIETWVLDELPGQRRLPGWESTLALVAGWLFIAVSLATWRSRPGRRPWVELLGAAAVLSTVLILGSSSAAYTIGRVLPAATVAVGAWLLARTSRHPLRLWAIGAAVTAAAAAAAAPFTRDAALIGHPNVVGSIVDSDSAYRVLLAGSEALSAMAMVLIAFIGVAELRRASRSRHAPVWFGIAVASAWAIAAGGSAVDYSLGHGSWAGGSLGVAELSSLALVPVVMGLRLVTSRWDRPELAGLVVDLGSASGELQPAVAAALEDPSAQVLHSVDGERLLDEDGQTVAEEDLAPDRSLTRIRSGERLIGGLVHDREHREDPARLTAVVAAIGLALDVNRLNREVMAQLGEVQASRRRIIEAGDAARQRVERDLHDGAQQRLVALGMDLQRAKRQAEAKGEEELAELLDSATSDVRRALDEIRLVSRGFHPSLLAERGLGAAVEALVERSPVPVRMEVVSDGVPAAIEKTAYYVVAEGLTNVAKHARATATSVRIELEGGMLQVVVSDDGAGGTAITPGSGLQGLEDRVVAAGGHLTVDSGPAGTTLTAVIPCE